LEGGGENLKIMILAYTMKFFEKYGPNLPDSEVLKKTARFTLGSNK